MSKSSINARALDFLFFISGGIIYSVAVLLFLSENEISPGGVTGVAAVLNHLLGLRIGTLVFILNIPLLVIGFIKFGGIFIIKTGIATAVISVILDISEGLLPKLEIDPMLAAVFGGLIMGLGISLFMLRGATTGGVDIVAKLINRKFPHLTVGRLMLIADAAVIAFNTLVYKNIESALYSVVAIYASSTMIDMLLYGADKGKIIYIITERTEELTQGIISLVNRGITLIDVKGGYTGKPQYMLMCTVRRNEASAVCRLIKEKEPKAFVVIAEAGEILGEGFKGI